MESLGPRPVATQVVDPASSIAPLQVTPVNAMVPTPVVTLSAMKASVDAVESAERRANAVLAAITRPYGANAESRLTKVAASRWLLPATAALGIGVTAALTYDFWPNGAAYSYSYREGWTHRVADSWYYKDVAAVLLGSLFAGAATFFGSTYGIERLAKRQKAKMADALLDGDAMEPFVRLLDAAKERPLERAAIAKVARATREDLKDRHIWFSPAVTAILSRSIEDEGLGDAKAREQIARHLAVLDTMRVIETATGDLDGPIASLEAALHALPAAERDPVAKDVYGRLFDNYRPRFKNIDYDAAQKLTALLA